jgi:hypothetical protein
VCEIFSHIFLETMSQLPLSALQVKAKRITDVSLLESNGRDIHIALGRIALVILFKAEFCRLSRVRLRISDIKDLNKSFPTDI